MMALHPDGKFNVRSDGVTVRTSIPNDECAVDDLRSGCVANIRATVNRMGDRLPQYAQRQLFLAMDWANAVDDYITAHSVEVIEPRR